MQICVAYLVCEKRERRSRRRRFFFFSGWLPRDVLVVDTKNIYLSLVRTPRVRSLSSTRVTRARLRMLSSSKSRLNCEFQYTLVQFLVIIAGKNSRERQKKERYKKTTREKPLSLERAFLKNTTTIYDIKYAAIFHVQNDVRVPRRHFSFHRHLTHVLRRPGRRREHFTFHFLLSFNVYACLFITCFLFLFFFPSRIFDQPKKRRKIKSKDISRRAHERIKKRTKRRTFSKRDFVWINKKKKCFIQAHCFRRKSRSQTNKKDSSSAREREGEDLKAMKMRG